MMGSTPQSTLQSTPQNTPQRTSDDFTGYIKVPGNWFGKIGETPLSPRGGATYRLLVKNLNYQGTLGLKKTNIRSSSTVYVNGRRVLQDGLPHLAQGEYTFSNKTALTFFEISPGDLEIIIQVANYDNIQGGITKALMIGSEGSITEANTGAIILESGEIAILLMIGLTYLLMYLVFKRSKENEEIMLSFSILCLSLAVFSSMHGEKILLLLLPWLNFTISFKIMHISSLISVGSIIVFLHLIGKGILSKVFRNAFLSLLSIFFIALLILPLHIYLRLEIFIIVIYGIFTAYVFANAMKAYFIEKRDPAKQTMVAYLILAMTVITIYNLDVLLYMYGFTDNINLGNLCLILFAGFLIILLSKRIYDAYKENLQMSLELAMQQKETMAHENAFLRSQINPHFLYNTLSTIISYCYTDGQKAGDLLNSFSEYLRRSFDFDSSEKTALLLDELDFVEAYVKIQKARFGESLKVEMNVDPEVMAMGVPAFTIQPLVENAIRHGVMKKVDGGIVRVSIEKKDGILRVEVSDDGAGMHQSVLRRIFHSEDNEGIKDPADAKKDKRMGVGLYNIQRRLQEDFGCSLQIESEPMKGTRIFYELPIKS